MFKVTLLGAGRIGRTIAQILRQQKQYQIQVADRSAAALEPLAAQGFSTHCLDVERPEALRALLQDQQAVISACSFHENPTIARAALESGASYFDLTEDVATTNLIRALAEEAQNGQIFMPQCGLAPGFIGILGHAMAQRFDELDTLKLRVGALPEFPSNPMMYNLTWSTDGLINEYCNPCEAIKEHEYARLRPLEGLETFSLNGVHYEAFNTSGGLGSLCETLQGQVRDLTYKTIRYPGHRHLMDFLLHDLRLGEPGPQRQLLKQIFEHAIAVTDQDIVIVFVTATGQIDGKLVQLSEHHKIYHGTCFDPDWSAIQISTAAALCVVVDMFRQGQLPERGFVRQEDVPFDLFMQNPIAEPFRASNQLQRKTHGQFEL